MPSIRYYKSSHRLVVTARVPDFSSVKNTIRNIKRHTPSQNTVQTLLASLFLVAGLIGVAYSLSPLFFQPAATALSEAPTKTITTPTSPMGMHRSLPMQLIIPDIELTTTLITTGKNGDGTMAVPERYDVAAWYELSPTPGEIGPSVIVGHVDNYLGAAIFFRLKELQPGQPIQIVRQDSSVATFTVERVALYDQAAFPTEEVYGNIDHAGLRLITCGGVFNPITGYYLQNTVVYARLSR